MKLHFLGSGDSFNYSFGNNAAYFKKEDTLYFIDMGQAIFAKALSLHLLDDIKHVVIFITHCHFDHIGSLGEAVTYFSVFHKEIDCSIVYPNPDELLYYLKPLYPFEGIKLLKETNGKLGGVSYQVVPAKHAKTSFAYFLSDSKVNIYYSGDNSELNLEAASLLKEGKLSCFFQDCSWKTSSFHYGIDSLEKDFDPSLRKKIVLMHLPSQEFVDFAKEKGFSNAKEMMG